MTVEGELASAQEEENEECGLDAEPRLLSYVIGAFLILLGIGMMVGYNAMSRGPSRMFNLLAAGGAGCFVAGLGLFLQPLDQDRLSQFQNNGNPIEVFGIMPVFWKIWLIVVLAAMGGGFWYVTQTTVRIGP